MKQTWILITLLALLGGYCASGDTPAPANDYKFDRADRQAAMKEYGLKRIESFQAKAQSSAIATGDDAKKRSSCESSAMGLAQVSGMSLSGSGGKKETAVVVACRSTKNNYEQCECDIGFK
ncbi:MAG: hypothetical protein CMN76_00885 [Spirochaetaceae bacterium]|nr:hypothetical protein [Spirochaetaceae bacterium]|tara:strand:+ start:54592 stop:54954 length:363 start_codon:yes stop_codon:yes gene_type:complete